MTASPSASARALLVQVVPAGVIGVLSALGLLVLSLVAARVQGVLWQALPGAVGIDPASPVWIVGMLTAVGLATGLVVTFVPGHAGPDPATTGLAAPPLPVGVLPGLALAVLLTLAGGVSLGPENPIIALNVGLAVGLGARLAAALPGSAWAGFAVSGTIGAMFGTPVAAALALSEMSSSSPRPLWDRIFGPLVAAAAGALTMTLLAGDSFALQVQPYNQPAVVDLVTGGMIAAAAALIGMVTIYAFRRAHPLFHGLGPPLVTLVVGGFLLGVLGAIGGSITLFKGLDQMKELASNASAYSPGALAEYTLIKLAAIVVAGTSGFRGGRIFPSVFAGVSIGLFVHAVVPAIPEAVALAGALMGILVAVTRSGWLSIFMVALMVGQPAVLPLACVIVLPAWLVVTGRPEMQVDAVDPESGQAIQSPVATRSAE